MRSATAVPNVEVGHDCLRVGTLLSVSRFNRAHRRSTGSSRSRLKGEGARTARYSPKPPVHYTHLRDTYTSAERPNGRAMWESACCEVTGQRVGTQARTQLKAGRPTTTDTGRHVRHRLVCNAVLLSLSLQQPSRTSADAWPCVSECMLLSGWSPSTEAVRRGTS